MCRLFESIKIEDNQIRNLIFHNNRINNSKRSLFGSDDYIDLADIIIIPESCRHGIYKCRVTYSTKIIDVNFIRYNKRNISSLKMVCNDDINYPYKYDNKKAIIDLLKLKEKSDDILIIKNNLVTDTSFSNIAFHDGNKWVTPASPLLKGTKREKLLTEGSISEDEIRVNDLKIFKKASLINAMLELGDLIIPVQNIS